jgi:hypothetical protein
MNAWWDSSNYPRVDARPLIRALTKRRALVGRRPCGLEAEMSTGKSRISAVVPLNRSVDAWKGPLYSVAGSRSEGIDAHP